MDLICISLINKIHQWLSTICILSFINAYSWFFFPSLKVFLSSFNLFLKTYFSGNELSIHYMYWQDLFSILWLAFSFSLSYMLMNKVLNFNVVKYLIYFIISALCVHIRHFSDSDVIVFKKLFFLFAFKQLFYMELIFAYVFDIGL